MKPMLPSASDPGTVWAGPAGCVRLFALCVLLGAATTSVTGFALGLLTGIGLVTAALILSIVRPVAPPFVVTASGVLLVIGSAAAVTLGVQAYWPALYRELSPFLPLLAVLAVLLASSGLFAAGDGAARTLRTTLIAAGQLLALATVLGIGRELVGHGSLLRDLALLTEPFADGPPAFAGLVLFAHERGFLLALLPAGAFIAFGLLLALGNALRRPS